MWAKSLVKTSWYNNSFYRTITVHRHLGAPSDLTGSPPSYEMHISSLMLPWVYSRSVSLRHPQLPSKIAEDPPFSILNVDGFSSDHFVNIPSPLGIGVGNFHDGCQLGAHPYITTWAFIQCLWRLIKSWWSISSNPSWYWPIQHAGPLNLPPWTT